MITVSRGRHPQSAQHVDDAQNAGHPTELTIDRHGATQRRRESMRGNPRQPGLDRDEYPPAMFREGGTGSSVRGIDPSDNRGAGSSMGHQARDLPDGTRVRLGGHGLMLGPRTNELLQPSSERARRTASRAPSPVAEPGRS